MVRMAEVGAPISLDGWYVCLCYLHFAPENPEDGEMYLLVPAHPGCPGQSPLSHKMVVLCVLFLFSLWMFGTTMHVRIKQNQWVLIESCDLTAGVGGNLVAVQASRLSTALHRVATPGHLLEYASAGCVTPWSAFCGKNMTSSILNHLVRCQQLWLWTHS